MRKPSTCKNGISPSRQRTSRELNAIFENALDAILLISDAGVYVDVNPAACALLGYCRDELLEMTILDLTPADNVSDVSEMWQNFRNGHSQKGIFCALCKGGRLCAVEFQAVPHILPGIHLSILRDVTERCQIEAELVKSKEFLAESQRLALLGSWEWDVSTDIVTASDELYRIFDIQGEMQPFTLQRLLQFIHVDDRAMVERRLREALHQIQPYDICYRVVQKDKTIRCVHARGHVEFDEQSKRTRMFGTSQDITEQKRAEKERELLLHQLKEGREQLQRLSGQLVEVQEAERRTIARELHDEIGQVLTGLKIQLEMSARQSSTPVGESQRAALAIVNDLMGKVRELSLNLRPTLLDDFGLIPTLLWHFERYEAQTNIQVDFKHTGLKERFAPEVETAIYRIVQEALTNVARHARVSTVKVRLKIEDGRLGLHISDRGVGFETETAAARASAGLSGMRERAALLRGQLTLCSTPKEGTQIQVSFPMTGTMERRGLSR